MSPPRVDVRPRARLLRVPDRIDVARLAWLRLRVMGAVRGLACRSGSWRGCRAA